MILRGLIYGTLCLLLLLMAIAWSVLATESGSLWLVTRLAPENIKVQGMQGRLLDQLQIEQLNISTPELDISIRDLKLQVSLLPLLLDRLNVIHLEVATLAIRRHSRADAVKTSAGFGGFPIGIGLPSISVRQIIYQQGDSTYVIDRLQSAGYLSGHGVKLSHLSLDYQEYKLAAELQLSLSDPWPLTGSYRLQTPYGELVASIEGSRHSISSRGVFQSLAVVANLDLDADRDPLVIVVSAPKLDLSAHTSATSAILAPSLEDLDLRIVSDFSRYKIAGKGVFLSRMLPPLPVVALGEYSNGKFALTNLSASYEKAEAVLNGHYLLQSQTFRGSLVLGQIPLPLIKPLLPPNIAESISLQGQISTRVEINFADGRISLDLPRITGDVNQRALTGSARLSAKELSDLKLNLSVNLEDNQLLTRLDMTAQKLQVDFNGSQLNEILPELQGQMQIRGEVSGLLGSPTIEGSLWAHNFEFNQVHLTALTATIATLGKEAYQLRIALDSLQVAGSRMGDLQADIQGSRQVQAGTLRWHLDDRAFSTQVSNRVKGSTGFGQWLPLAGDLQLSDSVLELPWGIWRSREAIPVHYAQGQAGLGARSCWHAEGAGELCANQLAWADGQFTVNAQLDHLPVNIARLPGTTMMQLVGDLDVYLNLQGSLRKWQGEFGFSMPQSQLVWSAINDDRALLNLFGQGEIDGYSLRGTVQALSSAEHRMDAKLSIQDVRQPLNFALSAAVDSQDIGLLTAVIPFIATGHGKAQASIDIIQSTSTQDGLPQRLIKGQLTLGPGVEAMIPALNLEFSEVQFTAVANSEREIDFSGKVVSGAGEVTLTGTSTDLLAADRQVQARLLGEQFLVINRPEIQMVASPDLVFGVAGRKLQVSGKLRLDSGQIKDKALRISPRTRSSDVVVISAEPMQPSGPIYELDLTLTVEDQVRILLYGLDARVFGALRVRQSASRPRQVEGVLNLADGVFSRYGVEFQLERGRLIYSSSVTNPVVDLVARREIDSPQGRVTVRLVMSGSASNLESRLVASPSMSEADALSYLILGRPLGRSSGADGSLLAGAAMAFGLKKAVPITAEIQAKLGLDELAVAGKDIDSAAVVAGKRVTRDLYLEYNYGLFSRIGGLLLDYQLSERLSLQAQSGAANSLELIYKF